MGKWEMGSWGMGNKPTVVFLEGSAHLKEKVLLYIFPENFIFGAVLFLILIGNMS